MNDAGNGVSVWDAPAQRYSTTASDMGATEFFYRQSQERVQRQRFRDLRFAIHYMYTNDGEVTNNVVSRQYGRRRHVLASPDDRRERLGRRPRPGLSVQLRERLSHRGQHGPGPAAGSRALGDLGHAPVGGARARAACEREPEATRWRVLRIGPEKCVFIYNTNQNRFHGNWFEGCEIGVHFTAGSEGNEIVGNAFLKNRNQVKYVGTRFLDWSKDGRGNYWSDNPAFDLNGDGIGDSAYRPNDLIDKVLDGAASEGARQQPRRAGHPLGAGAVPGAPPGRRRRHPSAHDAAGASESGRERPAMTAPFRSARRSASAGSRRCRTSHSRSRRARRSRSSAQRRRQDDAAEADARPDPADLGHARGSGTDPRPASSPRGAPRLPA